MHGSVPVSYTHLDVYKRQIYNRIRLKWSATQFKGVTIPGKIHAEKIHGVDLRQKSKGRPYVQLPLTYTSKVFKLCSFCHLN